MSLSLLSWLAVGAYALHILEEHILGWHGWARKNMNLPVEWEAYTTIEVVLLILGAIAAMLTPAWPMLGLAYIVFLVINVTAFHLLPMLLSGGKFSPGVISGLLLFYPLALGAYWNSSLPQNQVVWALVIGAAIILWPMLLLWLREQPYFRASDSVAAADPGPARKPAARKRK